MWIWFVACTPEKNTPFNVVGSEDTESEDVDSEGETTTEETVSTGAVRFVAIGDAGEGNPAQFAVAEVVRTVCLEKGCDFALYLGDNFYNTGVDSVDDVQFQEKFEEPYANLDFPFYVVLGNHDYGGVGNLVDRPEPQVDYTERSEKWTMPDRTHSFIHEHVQFLGLDTNALMWSSQWGGYQTQVDWVREAIQSAGPQWRIAFGHHPYISNGGHGVAGQYDGLDQTPIAAGLDVQRFVEEELCGNIDVYFSGHDHDLQWLEPQCGVEFIVSGAGAKNRPLRDWGVPTVFETDSEPGFVWVEIVDATMNVQFYGIQSGLLYEGSRTQ